MTKNRFTREQAIERFKAELSPFIIKTDKAWDTDPIAYKIFTSNEDEIYIEHGEFGYSEYSKPDVLQSRLIKIKDFLNNS